MTPSEIKPGMRFGNWEVIKFDHSNEHRIKYFLCKCLVCGTIRPVRGTSLISGTSTACSRTCMNTLNGQVFGRLTVLQRDKSKAGYYHCRCECGNIKSVRATSLKTGAIKSCGCLKIQKTKERFLKNAESYIGKKYGYLLIEDCELRGQDYWYKCKCDCGNTHYAIGKHLLNGTTQSCGCINSKANELMTKILTKYNIPFKREYRFEECKDKRPLPFDFALFNNEQELIGLIENNGIQHYSTTGTSWNTPERFVKQQKHDYIKRKFSEDNQIPLLIIPYHYFNELEKFLITSDFWEIITKNFNDYVPLNGDSEELLQNTKG